MDHRTEDCLPATPRSRDRRTASDSPATWAAGLRSQRALVLVAAVAAILVLATVGDVLSSAGRVHPGVSVGGIDVGGKSQEAALAMLQASLPAKLAVADASYGAKTWTVKPSQVAATFDYPKLVAEAYSVGRSGGLLGSVGARIHSWAGGTALPAPVAADPVKVGAAVDRIASAIDQKARNASLDISASGVGVKPSAAVVTVNRALVARQLVAAMGVDASRAVRVSAAVTPPAISDAAAERARVVAQRMVGATATVTYGAKSWTLSRAELARMVSVRAVTASSSASLEPFVDGALAAKVIVPKVGAALGSQPVDARFVPSGSTVHVVASKNGIGPDVADFSASLSAALQQAGSSRSVELRTKVTSPSLTTAKALAMGIRERISTFTTTYSTGLPSRVNNIHVLGAALDGKLVAPGDTFSLNDAVGPRTAAKGYQEANAIVQGKLVSQMGGGICQVATTMFNAVFMSGLPITERVAHSFYIAHYPMGRDCTVSWGGPDLRWRNSTSSWVLVSVERTSDSITVSLYGTSPGYDVAFTTTPFTNNVPYKTTKVTDPTLTAGVQQVASAGLNGGRAVVVRKVTKNGALVRTDTFTSDNVPVVETVAVGTLKPVAKTSVTSLTAKK